MATGPFEESDPGTVYYHSKVGAVELLLNHLIDEPGEYVVMDMTAGADSFASDMFTKFDVTSGEREGPHAAISELEPPNRAALEAIRRATDEAPKD